MKREYEIPYLERLKGDEKKVVIIAHGFASSMNSPTAQMLLDTLPMMGIGAIAFDFPAHGASTAGTGNLSVANCIADLNEVWDYVRKKCPNAEICYFGSSFGAYITLLHLTQNPHKSGKAFLRSAAVNMDVIFENSDETENLVTPELLKDLKAHNLFELYKPGKSKVMMIHGVADESIDYAKAVEFAEKFEIPLITVEGGDHRLSAEGMPEAVVMSAIDFYLS